MGDFLSKNLKNMSNEELTELSKELRFLVTEVTYKNGGHLASNLGVMELTVALHKVFDFKTDKLLFDVGHQCYAHKLLTGRADRFDTLRQLDGISGFPKREESEFDAFGAGHSGTAVSAASGVHWIGEDVPPTTTGLIWPSGRLYTMDTVPSGYSSSHGDTSNLCVR